MEQVILDHLPFREKECQGLISLTGKFPNFIKSTIGLYSNYSVYIDHDNICGTMIGGGYEGVKLEFLYGKLSKLFNYRDGKLIDEFEFYDDSNSSKYMHRHHDYLNEVSTTKYWDGNGNRINYYY